MENKKKEMTLQILNYYYDNSSRFEILYDLSLVGNKTFHYSLQMKWRLFA